MRVEEEPDACVRLLCGAEPANCRIVDRRPR